MAIRVLHVLNNLGSGGAEAFIMNMYRAIDRDKVQFDFLIRSNQNGHYIDEIKAMGGEVYILPSFPKHIFRNYKMLREFLHNHHTEYHTIHVHANSLIYIKPLQIAMREHIPQRIIHSHSVKPSSWLPAVVHICNREKVNKYVTKRLACGEEAGEWMYGKRKFEVINNGIDIMRFSFNKANRERIRKQYQVENAYVIGHVGRFTAAKNHKLLLKVFQQYFEDHENAVLMLIGDGEELCNIKAFADQLNITDKIKFVGSVENVADFLSAMDVFLFPSVYEGLGIALIEAQANGLPCVVSDSIVKKAILNTNCKIRSLNDSVELWADEICTAERVFNISEELQDYNSGISAKRLERIYLNEE